MLDDSGSVGRDASAPINLGQEVSPHFRCGHSLSTPYSPPPPHPSSSSFLPPQPEVNGQIRSISLHAFWQPFLIDIQRQSILGLSDPAGPILRDRRWDPFRESFNTFPKSWKNRRKDPTAPPPSLTLSLSLSLSLSLTHQLDPAPEAPALYEPFPQSKQPVDDVIDETEPAPPTGPSLIGQPPSVWMWARL